MLKAGSSQSGAEKRLSAGAGLAADHGANFASGSANVSTKREALRAASPASASCLPGDAARCNCQSAKASASAAGETPPVKRAMVAVTERSIASGIVGGNGGAPGHSASRATTAGTGNGTT